MTAPLAGRTVLVTRAPGQAGEIVRLLREAGAEVAVIPTIEIVPPADWGPADSAIDRLEGYDWVILTSENAVDRFLGRVRERRGSLAALAGPRICAVGPKTRDAIAGAGLQVAFMPRTYRAEALVEEAGAETWRGRKILFPRAEQGREVIPAAMRSLDARLDTVTVYRTVPSAAGRERLASLLRGGGLDAVTFTSGSTVESFAALLDPMDLPRVRGPVVVACIGPVTAEAAAAAGLPPDVVAEKATIASLVEALARRFAAGRAPA